MCHEKGTTKQKSLDKLQETGRENLLPCFFWLRSFESLGWAEISSFADVASLEIELSLSAAATLSWWKAHSLQSSSGLYLFHLFSFSVTKH